MKGKLALAVGFAAGYVLGARAGRSRYNQIKRGAEKVWETDAVQTGVEKAREFAGTRVDEVKDKAIDTASALLKSGSKTAKRAADKVSNSGS